MVYLENYDEGSSGKHKNTLLFDWREIWHELDSRLLELGQTNAAAYADLMMEQEVVIDKISKPQIGEVISSIDNILKQITVELKKAKQSIKDKLLDDAEGAQDLVESLDYEVDELKNLRGYLNRRLKSPSSDKVH